MPITKNILIISNFFSPEITPRAFRTTELVKEFARRNFNVTLYLPHKKHVDYESVFYGDNVKIEYFTREPFKTYIPQSNNILSKVIRKVLLTLYFYFQFPEILLSWYIFKNVNKNIHYDILLTIAYPHSIHWGGYLLSHYNLFDEWLADCGDPFMGNQVKKPPFYFKYLEKAFCRAVDYLIVPTESSVNGYYTEFRSKIQIIPQGFNFDEIPKFVYKPNSIPTFAYAGSFYKGYRDPSRFIKFLNKLDFDFKFIVYSEESSLTDMMRKLLGDKLIINSIIPRNQLIVQLSRMDFLINFANNGQNQTPSKLIDYALAARPILTIYFNLDNFDNFNQFVKGNYTSQTFIHDLQQYNIKNIVDKFTKLLK